MASAVTDEMENKSVDNISANTAQDIQYRNGIDKKIRSEEFRTGIDVQSVKGNTDLHNYALNGKFKKFQSSFNKFKEENPDRPNFLEIVSKFNEQKETALAVALSKRRFKTAFWLLSQLEKIEIQDQFDMINSISGKIIDEFINDVCNMDSSEAEKVMASILHKAAELKRNRHGGDYQAKLLMLLAYQSYSNDIQFRLGSEVAEAGKCDDLVLCYKDSDGKNKRTCLQAKHEQHLLEKNFIKVADLTNPGHKYGLKIIFQSHAALSEESLSEVDSLVLCTNNRFDINPDDFPFKEMDGVMREGENLYKMFSDLRGKLYKFNFKDENDENNFIKKLFANDVSQIDKPKIKLFMSKFVFAVEQPSSTALSEIIKEKMGGDKYNFIYFATFKEYIDEWFASRRTDNTARFILHSEIREYFNGIKNKIASIELNGLAPLFKARIETFTQHNLKFKSNSKDVINVKRFLNSMGRISKLTFKEKDSFLSIAKVYQILNNYFKDKKWQYIFSDLQSLVSLNFDGSNEERVVNAFKPENKHLLVIECNVIDENGKNLINQLCEYLNCYPTLDKKIIFVLSQEVNYELVKISEVLRIASEVKMENSLSSLTLESRKIILETKIKLFGQTRQLASFAPVDSPDDICSAIDGDALFTLINGNSNTIGCEHKYDFDTYIDIRRTYKKNHKEGQINEITDSAIIAGEPGIGKSTVLTTYSQKTDSPWRIRINLNHYENYIQTADFGDLSGIVKFLTYTLDKESSKTSLIENLLQYCLKRQDQVTLLLDGYDEIKDDVNRKKIVQLFRNLKYTRVLLTVSSFAQSELENALGIFPCTLNPFSDKEQHDFLNNFWIKKLGSNQQTANGSISKFSECLLNKLNNSPIMKTKGLVGIPLQAGIVARLFQDECKNYVHGTEFGFSILDLFESVTEHQYKIYFEKIENSTKLSEYSRNIITSSYTEAYCFLAIKSLFSEEQIQGLISKEPCLGNELQDIGLIKSLKKNSADFIHPTYAEYFVAKFLVNGLRQEKTQADYKEVNNFLLRQIFRDQNEVIRDFVKNMIEKEKNSDLNSKWKAIQDCDLLGEVGEIVSEKSTDLCFLFQSCNILFQSKFISCQDYDKEVFIKMLAPYVNFSMKAGIGFQLAPRQLQATLELFEDMLKKLFHRSPTLISEIIEFLFALGKAGLKVIDSTQGLLVLDPASDFLYILSGSYVHHIVDLITWKNENFSKSKNDFLKKCHEVIEPSPILKRRVSESDLHELKKLK